MADKQEGNFSLNTQAPISSMWQQHAVRGDIQGLRAIAVLLVLIFHIWPEKLPGGYIGVDVFFVISGYLIVGSLVKELERNGRISLIDFYRRRARRLMPAALLVLSVVLAGTIILLPASRWEDSLLQIAASALYVQNWYLSWASVDYLAAENAASPVLHYWSLSIEEQFYITWPLVMLAIGWLLPKTGASARAVSGVVLCIVFCASLATSLVLTTSTPEQAYFVSHTRIWEIALGGLIAIWLPNIRAADPTRAILFLTGLGLILLSAFTFEEVAFPGWRALLPTGGAALIILAGGFRVGMFKGVDAAGLRYIGDISYSLYLWHWPIIVFYTVWNDAIGLWGGLGIIGLTFLISHFSYHYIEQQFRRRNSNVNLGPISVGLLGTFFVAGCSALVYGGVVSTAPGPQSSVGATSKAYPGPAALLSGAVVPEGVPLRPAPAHLPRDRSPVYDTGCHQNQRRSEVSTCVLGDKTGNFTVAVVGSSHSVNWLPALDVLGAKNGWRILSITKSACGFRTTGSDICDKWHNNVVEYLEKSAVDLAFISENAGKTSGRASERLIASRWKKISDLGVPILAVRPIPHLEKAPGDCLPDRIQECVIDRDAAERANTIAFAAEQVADVHIIDMNDAICNPETCGPVVGNIIVFRDTHHLTATYSRALAPYLERQITISAPGLAPIKEGEFASDDLTPAPHSRDLGATLRCGPSSPRSNSFSRIYSLAIDQHSNIVLQRGDWEEEKENFEVWKGTIDRDVVNIEGRYKEGVGGIKTVDFVGTARDGKLIAAGLRGPRTCSVHWNIPEDI